jgi:EAL domain-containing protein (putative c-di-GMP-specific phosphodiesterase class I)
MSLIRDIDTASSAKREMVQSLVTFAKNTGITTLAEGVETQSELDVCQEMGFELIQGYLYGKPKPIIFGD